MSMKRKGWVVKNKVRYMRTRQIGQMMNICLYYAIIKTSLHKLQTVIH